MTLFASDQLVLITVGGEDAEDFLQAQLSSDVSALTEDSRSGFSCYCTPRGKVIALLLVTRVEGGFHLLCHRDLAPGLVNRLQIYVFRLKVDIAIREDAVLYPAEEGDAPPAGVQAYHADSLGLSWYSDPSLEAPQATTQNRQASELAAGVAWLDSETTEQYIPQMLGYEELGALSFSKGCYPGQEIVARARYLGKVKRGLHRVRVGSEVEAKPMDPIRLQRGEDWSEGRIVGSAVDSDGSTVVLAVSTREPEVPVEQVELGGSAYRCATI